MNRRLTVLTVVMLGCGRSAAEAPPRTPRTAEKEPIASEALAVTSNEKPEKPPSLPPSRVEKHENIPMAEERVISYQKVSEKGANSVQSPEKRGKDSGGLSDTDIASIAILSTMAVGILTLTAEHVGFRMGKSYFVPEKKAEGIELIELNRRQKTYKIYAVRDGKRKILTIDYTDRAKAQRVLMDAGFSSSLAFDILDVKEPFATIEGPFKRSATRIGKAFMAAFIPFQPVLQLSKIAITGPASILINAGTEAYESWKKAPNVLLKPAEAIGGAVKGAVSAPISMVTTSAVAGFYAVPREYMRIIQRQNPAAIKKAYRK